MPEELLEILCRNNRPRNWAELRPTMRPKVVGQLLQEPIYEFFYTFDSSLEVDPHSISLSVQPVTSYIPYHIHDYLELSIPIKGEFIMHTKSETIAVKENEIIMIGNKTVHKIDPIAADSIVINLALKDSAFSLNDFGFMRNETQPISTLLFSLLANEKASEESYCLFHTGKEAKVKSLVEDFLQEYYFPKVQTDQLIHLEILTLFTRLLRSASENKSQVQIKKQARTDLLAMLLYIEKNYAQITLPEMADAFSFNPNYLSAYLKKQTGLSFMKLVHLQRVNAAAGYLSYTSAAIEEISLKIGYENPSYFYKIFRQTFQMSPREYRQKNRK